MYPYFDQIERAVETGWFDTIGHLDIPKRYMPSTHRDYDPPRYKDRLMELFSRVGRERGRIRDQHIGYSPAAKNKHARTGNRQMVYRGRWNAESRPEPTRTRRKRSAPA